MPGDMTQLLSAIDSGDPKAAEELLPLVYQELRRLAAHKMADERAGHWEEIAKVEAQQTATARQP